jgi:hypothetical protein
MPLKYWDNAFLTAVYLINRTSSKVLGYETPLEHLFNQKSDYKSLRVFGCTCWPNLCLTIITNSNFHSQHYVFLGFSSFHKGFKCLDPKSGRVYISRDVTFDEIIFPFFELHPNAGRHLQDKIALLPPNLLNTGVIQLRDHVSNNSNPVANPSVSTRPQEHVHTTNTEEPGLQEMVHTTNIEDGPGTGTEADSPAPDHTTASTLGSWTLGAASTPNSMPPGAVSASNPVPIIGTQTDSAGFSAAGEASAPEHTLATGSTAAGSASGAGSSAVAHGSVAPEDTQHVSHHAATHGQRGIRKPKIYTNGTIRYVFLTTTVKPENLKDANMGMG